MPDTVDPAAAPPRTLAQIIEGTGAALYARTKPPSCSAGRYSARRWQRRLAVRLLR